MAFHFDEAEFQNRIEQLQAKMAEEKLDAMLLFAQESMYWLTGYDTFGSCFFQCLVFKADGTMHLLTRAPDLRQAQHTSSIKNITLWMDHSQAVPMVRLSEILDGMDLLGASIGVEYNCHGLNAHYGRLLDNQLSSFARLSDASTLVSSLRMIKSKTEIKYVKKAAKLADDALDAALELIHPGANEADILAAMQSAVFSQGGDYPGNEFIIGSGHDALLCRYKAGRRKLSKNDQLTLEWAGAWAHYHAAMMRTAIIGKPSDRHLELYEAALAALKATEEAMVVGGETPNTFGDVFNAHAQVLDNLGLAKYRLNACGYCMGAKFAPSWMDYPMFYADNSVEIVENMTLFIHIIIMDDDQDCAMTLGQSYLTKKGKPESLSRHGLELIICPD
jgi:Xaa-Pro dipeptidase